MSTYQILEADNEIARLELASPPVIGEVLILRHIAESASSIHSVRIPGDYVVTNILSFYVGGLYDTAGVRKVVVKTIHPSEQVFNFNDANAARSGLREWERSRFEYPQLKFTTR